MDLPEVVSRQEWEAARRAFEQKDERVLKLRDELYAERRALPAFRIEKDYSFDTPDGKRTLPEMFEGRWQLIVYHFTPSADYPELARRMGWTTPVFSSVGTTFYADMSFPISEDEPQTPGISVYIRDEDDTVYLTYHARDRGTEPVNNTYNYLDMTFLGRREPDGKPRWVRLHDSYDHDAHDHDHDAHDHDSHDSYDHDSYKVDSYDRDSYEA